MPVSRCVSIGVAALLVAVPVGAEYDACGGCLDWQEWLCSEYQMSDCHAWGYDDAGMQPRGNDMHFYGGAGAYIAPGSCAEYHAAPCDPGLTVQQAEDFNSAVVNQDIAAVKKVMTGLRNAAIGFDDERRSIVLRASCALRGRTSVVASVALSGAAAEFWKLQAADENLQ